LRGLQVANDTDSLAVNIDGDKTGVDVDGLGDAAPHSSAPVLDKLKSNATDYPLQGTVISGALMWGFSPVLLVFCSAFMLFGCAQESR